MSLRRKVAETVSLAFAAWWLAATGVTVSVMMIANRIDADPKTGARQAPRACSACRGDRYVCNLCYSDGARCQCSTLLDLTSIPCTRCAR